MATTDYGKVVVGEAIDDEPLAPLIASGVPVQNNIEPSAIPVLYRRPPPPQIQPPAGVYGTYPVSPPMSDDFREPGEDCAQLGCFFSWIPPIGYITCCMHADAPPMSRREYWAHRSCIVATIISLFLIIFWVSWEENDDDRMPHHRLRF